MSDTRYDYNLTVFSPNGRLLQIEYALVAVKNGQPANGVQAKDGVVLATETYGSTLSVEIPKIVKVSEHHGFVYAGIGSDARLIGQKAQEISCNYKLQYFEEIPIKQLVHQIGSFMHSYTQMGGRRPFGCSLLVAGWNADDGKAELYQVDPSGTYFGWKASSIGKNDSRVKNFLENRYNGDIGLEDAAHTSLLALREAFDMPMKKEQVEMAVCTSEGFITYTKEKIGQLIEDI